MCERTRQHLLAMAAMAFTGASAGGSAGATDLRPTDDESHVSGKLSGKRVAILVTEGFEQEEMTEPRRALDAAGAKTLLIVPHGGQVKAWNHAQWGDQFKVDVPLDEARADQFDALLLPGGVMSPDKLRTDPRAVAFVKKINDAGKPIAAICHGPWTLIEADAVRGRTLTSWPSLQTDIKNAGGTWTDAPVVSDHGLVTSRKPADIPAFNERMIEQFAQSPQPRSER